MGFVKVVKNNAYYKRFQVKFRRRREGKTDYRARLRLVNQDKNKYDAHKYRFVVRISNSKILCQIIYASIIGDKVLCQAQSNELSKFGLTVGMTNYSSAYCTGLLLARRLLKQVGLEKTYTGVSEATGEYYDAYDEMESGEKTYRRKPFKAFLDVGLVRTTTGNRVFGAMKGACDGGIHIPHSERRFPGGVAKNPKDDEGPTEYDPEVHRKRIFGLHIQEYMDLLKNEDAEKYKVQFNKWDAALKKLKLKTVEDVYKKIHAEIRKNPEKAKKDKKTHKNDRKGQIIHTTNKVKYRNDKKLTLQERKARVEKKITEAIKNAS